jgi:hypothetical protein
MRLLARQLGQRRTAGEDRQPSHSALPRLRYAARPLLARRL